MTICDLHQGEPLNNIEQKNSTEMLAVILGAIECQGPNLFLSFITVISF